ncbi:universal stress protein [Haloarchaeobius sp. TZWWS8]|uniref:universal stress protein n=1 Tax=Haloarchaeobius sp. TZWWS8 TaxID=3446121 RepID=UPI003EB72261
MYDDILLPTDGSDETSAAVEHAAEVAQRFGSTVHVLSVVDTRNRFESPSAGISPSVWEDMEDERAEAAIDAAIDALPDDVETVRRERAGVPTTEILEYADESACDLVVMATHGRTGLEHYLIGSVAEKVVRKSPVPVMTIREG